MNPNFKKIIEIFIVLWVFYYFIYMFAYVYFLDSYCNKYSQEIDDTKNINLVIIADCRSNYFCEVLDKQYIWWKLSSYKCNKKILNRFEYKYYETKFNELIK